MSPFLYTALMLRSFNIPFHMDDESVMYFPHLDVVHGTMAANDEEESE